MFNAPVAPWLSDAQISQYKQFLDEKAFGAQKNAVAYFEGAMKKGYETSVYNQFVAKAKYELRFFQEVTGGKYYDANEIVPPSNMIETSSYIGKIDVKFNFPQISKDEREKLKKMLNQPKVQTVPANAQSGTQKTEVKPQNQKQEKKGE
jgi:hypothetical protein